MRTFLFVLLFTASCTPPVTGDTATDTGGDTGSADTKRIADLTAEEIEAICADYPERLVDCGGFSVGLNGNCAGYLAEVKDTCALTVADFRACSDAQATMSDEDACARVTPPECDALRDSTCI